MLLGRRAQKMGKSLVESNSGLVESLKMQILETTPDLLAICSSEARFLWVSDSWQEALGWSVADLVDSPFLDFVLESDRDRTLAEFETMLREGRNATQFHNRYRHRDGGHRWLEWNAIVVEGNNTLCVARDISERKEQELREHERMRQMEMAEDLVGLGSWRVDLKAGRPIWSPKVYEIHGRDPETYTPDMEEAIEAYHVDDRERVSEYVERAVKEHTPFEFEARIVRPSGEVRLVRSRGVPEVDQDGEVVSLFGVFRDVTEERGIEESMRRSERMASIGTMAAGIAHEINNPLSYVLGNLQLLEEDLDEFTAGASDDTLAGMRDMIADSAAGAERIRKIVDGVRSFTRVEESVAQAVDVNAAVGAAVSFAEHELKVRAVLNLSLNATRPAWIDETQLVQVLVNLLINAAQALPEGCAADHSVSVTTEDAGRFLSIRVADTGPGVPPELRERIFDPFYTTKPVGTGTGLGLSICHTIIEQCGGSIELEPSQRGARFHIKLPVAAAAPGDAGYASDSDSGGAEPPSLPSLLIVDDEPAVRHMLGRALRKNFAIRQAGSGREALRLIDAGTPFDMILCDVMMPEVAGMDVLERLRAVRPELVPRFVFATGGSFSEEVRSALQRDGVEVVRKPIEVIALREHLAARMQKLERISGTALAT